MDVTTNGVIFYSWRMMAIKTAAEKAGVSDTTIRRWIRLGILKAVQPVKRGVILIPEAELSRVLSTPRPDSTEC